MTNWKIIKAELQLFLCGICKHPMIPLRRLPSTATEPVLGAHGVNVSAIDPECALASNSSDANGDRICSGCASTTEIKFVCAICSQERLMREEEKSFGWPPERLCKSCYASTPAKAWQETVKRLEHGHRYDFE